MKKCYLRENYVWPKLPPNFFRGAINGHFYFFNNEKTEKKSYIIFINYIKEHQKYFM